jgi:hypothetical protein
MRAAKWMALAVVGLTPLVTLAQTAPATATQASPSGAASINRGQDTAGFTGNFDTTGQPAGGALFPGIPGLNGVPLQQQGSAGAFDTFSGTGGSGTTSGATGTTYRGSPDPGASSTASSGSATGSATSDSGQADVNQLGQRVEALEREVSALRGTGGAGTTGAPVTPRQPAVTNSGSTGANTSVGTSAQAPAATRTGTTAGNTPGTSATAGNTTGTGTATASNDETAGEAQQLAPITVEFDGRVRDVSSKYVEVVDSTDGTVSRLQIDKHTRVYRGSSRNRIPMKQLSEGSQVRTSFAYVDGVELARDIVVLSPARKSQR